MNPIRFWKGYFAQLLGVSFLDKILGFGKKLLDTVTGGDILGGLLGASGQHDANVASARQAKEQMDFQERMSNTAHRREVADLRAAGLNPILSGTGGAGSSSPPGAMARQENVPGAGIASAVEAATLKNMKKQRELMNAQTLNTTMDTAKKDKERTWWHIEGEKSDIDRRILEHEEKGARIEGNIDSSAYGIATRHANRASGVLGGANALRNLFRQRR